MFCFGSKIRKRSEKKLFLILGKGIKNQIEKTGNTFGLLLKGNGINLMDSLNLLLILRMQYMVE